MSNALSYDRGVNGFDQTFGVPMRQFIPTLLKSAHVGPGQRVLDVATGTGAAAKMALDIVGPNGHVTAVDISKPMLDEARRSLARAPNVAFEVQNGEGLTLPDASFDAVVCSMALMIFADRASALAGFYRVLRRGGRAAASLNTTPARGLTTHVRTALANLVPEKAMKINADRAHHYDICQADRVQALFEAAGFRDVTTTVETRTFAYPSFDAYYKPIAGGGGPWGAEHAELPPEVQRQVRQETLRIITGKTDEGGPISIPVDVLFAAGQK